MVLVRGVDILSLERYKVVQFVFFFLINKLNSYNIR